MKHSAKAAARLARHRQRQARRDAAAEPADLAQPATGPGSAFRTATAVSDSERRARRPRLAQLAYGLVLAGILVGLAIMHGGGQAVKGGTLVIAGAVLAGSLTRLILPDGRAGLLESRQRLVDVALLTVIGTGLLTAGLIVQVPG